MRIHWACVALLVLVCSSVVGCSGGDSFEVTTTVVSGEYTQDIWVTSPDAADSDEFGTWPLVYALHGLGGSGEGLTRTAEELAKHGAVVFSASYRSEEPQYIEQDAECGYRYAMANGEAYGADLARPITLIGHSMGASMSLFGGLNDAAYGPDGTYDLCYEGQPRPSVIVPIAGCHYEFEGESWPFDTSPFSDTGASITMVVGTDDDVCAPWQSQDATDALVTAGHDATVIEIEGGNHANVVFFGITDGEWVRVDEDPVGTEVAEIILDAMREAEE